MPQNDLGAVIARFRHLQHRYLHPQLKSLGVFRGQPGVLHALEESPGLSQSDLTRRIHVRAPTATRMIERMAEAGLIERVADRSDHRVNRLFLTDRGLEVSRRLQEVHDRERDEVFSILSELIHQYIAGDVSVQS